MGALRCLWRGTNSLRRLRDDEDFMPHYVCCIAHRRRERRDGPIQSGPDRAYRHGGEPPQDPVRRLLRLLWRWVSRVCVLAAPSPTMALVSPAPLIAAIKTWSEQERQSHSLGLRLACRRTTSHRSRQLSTETAATWPLKVQQC